MSAIGGPKTGYRITNDAMNTGHKTSNEEVLQASQSASTAEKAAVKDAIETSLKGDKHISLEEFSGGRVSRLARFIGIDVGDSIMSAMKNDEWLQWDSIGTDDYQTCKRLLKRGALPKNHKDHLTMDKEVQTRMEKLTEKFERDSVNEAQTSAFVETINHNGKDQKVVTQTARRRSPGTTEDYFKNLPPEKWPEECYDLKNLHSEVVSEKYDKDGGYEKVMIQRMSFSDGSDHPLGSVELDMTKRTVTRKWKDPETGNWRAESSWKVFSSDKHTSTDGDTTKNVSKDGTMLIDEGSMSWEQVEMDGKPYVDTSFNNRTQTNTQREDKLLGLFGKKNPIRENISAQLTASPAMGAPLFAGKVVDRFAGVGSGKIEPRWQNMASNTEDKIPE